MHVDHTKAVESQRPHQLLSSCASKAVAGRSWPAIFLASRHTFTRSSRSSDHCSHEAFHLMSFWARTTHDLVCHCIPQCSFPLCTRPESQRANIFLQTRPIANVLRLCFQPIAPCCFACSMEASSYSRCRSSSCTVSSTCVEVREMRVPEAYLPVHGWFRPCPVVDVAAKTNPTRCCPGRLSPLSHL